MNYWIQHDQTGKVTNISKDDKTNQLSWVMVYVSKSQSSFFESNFNEIIYNTSQNALSFPNDYQSEQQLQNNNSYAYNSLSNAYSVGLSNANTTLNSVATAFSNYKASNDINITNLNNVTSDNRKLAQIKDGKNYLSSTQQDDIKNYFLTNTPMSLTNIFSNVPATNVPISLAIKVFSSKWQYIAPQFNGINNVSVKDNTIILNGSDVNTLQQVVNTNLAQKPNSIWSILHYGDDITITDVGVYYGDVPTGKNVQDALNAVNALQDTISLMENVISANSKGAQTGIDYLSANVKSTIINAIMYASDLNLTDIFQNVPTLNGKLSLNISANSPSWDAVSQQLQKLPNVTVNNNKVSINGNGVIDLKNNLSQQLSRVGTNVWAILHYGDHVTINDVSLTFD